MKENIETIKCLGQWTDEDFSNPSNIFCIDGTYPNDITNSIDANAPARTGYPDETLDPVASNTKAEHSERSKASER